MKIFILSMTLWAWQLTAATGIQYTKYYSNKIPILKVAAGIASEIIFAEDEEIVYHTFGSATFIDSKVIKKHILVLGLKGGEKATLENFAPQTNLLVHTNKRHYVFLIENSNNNWADNPNDSGAIYSLRLTYPETGFSKIITKKKNKTLRNEKIATKKTYLFTDYYYRVPVKNTSDFDKPDDYTLLSTKPILFTSTNSSEIIPYRVWDNGKITFIAFKAGTKRASIYEVDKYSGKESLVNTNVEKNGIVIIHGVYPYLMIRLDDKAVELRRNDKTILENKNKTNIKNLFRRVKNNG